MTIADALDLDDLIDGQRLDLKLVVILIVAMLTLISDEFDLSAMGYVAPDLAKLWHVAPACSVPAFSAGIIGLFVGAPLLGWAGDRFGRKRIVVAGLVGIGLVTLATTAVTGTGELVALRLLTGIGLGGVIPNVVALIAEIVPRRVRGRMVVLVALGVVIGIGLPGVAAATLVPAFGWRALLVVGGALPLLFALASIIVMPESLRYLAQQPDRAGDMRRLARQLRPDLVIGDSTRLAFSQQLPAMRGARRASYFLAT